MNSASILAIFRSWPSLAVTLLCGILLLVSAPASACVANISGDWNNAGTWHTCPTGTPTAASNVIISIGGGGPGSEYTVTIPAGINAQAATISIGDPTTGGGGNQRSNSLVLAAANSSLTVSGNVTLNKPSRDGTAATLAINNGTAILGSLTLAKWEPDLRRSDVIITGGSLTITGNLSTEGTAANTLIDMAGGAGVLRLNGAFTSTAMTLSPGTASTFIYGGANQTALLGVSEINYHNLTFAGSGTKSQTTWVTPTITGTTTVNAGVTFNNSASVIYQGNFANNGATNATASQTYNGNFVNAGSYSATAAQLYRGNFTNTGTFTSGGSNHTFNGVANQTLTGATTFARMVVNNNAGLTLNSGITVTDELSLTNGVVTTGGNVLRVAQTGWSGVTRTNGWVAGNLGLWMPTGNQTRVFDIGDGSAYRPLSVTVPGTVTTPGYLIARISQSAGDHPQIAASSLDPDLSVNRFWTLDVSGLVASSMNVTFNYLAGDRDAGANPLNFGIERFDGSDWNPVTVGTRTATSTQGVNITDLTGQFAIAELDADVVAYYTISHSGIAVTCEAEPITIIAWDADDNPVAPPDGTVINLATNPATGIWVGGNTYIFSGAETTLVRYLQQTTPQALIIELTDGTLVASSDPLVFGDTALRFYGNAALDPVPHQVAGVTDAAPVLRAVRTNTDTGACEGRVEGAQTVQLAYECRNPETCIAGQTFTIAGAAAQANNNGAAISYTPVSLTFDAAGSASIPINYTDVGQLRLHAQLALPAQAEDPAITLAGSSNEFVVKPHTVVINSVTTAGGTPNPGTTTAGSGFVAAGEVFHASIEVRNFQGNRTPNFGNETAPQGVRADFGALTYPAGGVDGTFTGGSSFTLDTTPGRFVSESLSWNEVGSFTLVAAITGDDYLGAGPPVSQPASPGIGRFYPADYALVSHSVANSCSGFSFMNQPEIEVNYSLEARATGGGRTLNYDNDGLSYAGTATVNYVAEHAQSGDGANWTARLDITNGGVWNQGLMEFTDPGAAIMRQGNTQPDGPYDVHLGLVLTDALDSRPLDGLNMNPTTAGSCTDPACTAIAIGGQIDLRFGRLVMDNAFGPETNNLPVNFTTQYWNGSAFVTAFDDNCTTIPRSAIEYNGAAIDLDANRTVAIGGGTTQGQYANLDADNVVFSSGSAGHFFSAPGANNTGGLVVDVSLVDLPWLRFDWNQDGNFNNVQALPPVSIGFGSYRGHDRVIYWREILE